jgi:hypothetical protein
MNRDGAGGRRSLSLKGSRRYSEIENVFAIAGDVQMVKGPQAQTGIRQFVIGAWLYGGSPKSKNTNLSVTNKDRTLGSALS